MHDNTSLIFSAAERASVMRFVGRGGQIRHVWGALARGRHVVISGPHGIGRTSLMRHIAAGCGAEMPFVFVDMSATSGGVTRVLYDALCGRGRAADISYRTARHRLFQDIGTRGGPCVLVLDDLARVTRQRLELVAGLARAGRFRIAAIVGARLPEREVDAVRATLAGADLVPLGWLRPREVRQFLREASAAYDFRWGENEIDARARSIGGYPLAMAGAVEEERLRRTAHREPSGIGMGREVPKGHD